MTLLQLRSKASYNDRRRDGVVVDSLSRRPAAVTSSCSSSKASVGLSVTTSIPNGRRPTQHSWRAVIPEVRGHALWIRSPRSRPRDFLFALYPPTGRQHVTVHVGAEHIGTMMDNVTLQRRRFPVAQSSPSFDANVRAILHYMKKSFVVAITLTTTVHLVQMLRDQPTLLKS